MNKRIVILGAAESGTGAAILAQAKGFSVFVSDRGTIQEKYRNELTSRGIGFEEGKHSEAQILSAHEIIKSPGIPENAALVLKAKAQNIPVISELEFAARYTNAKKICITGSNGKTTTTMMVWHILKSAGVNVGLAGNVGKSFARQVAENDFDVYVIEVSSFQLDGMFNFKADTAILLNITPDHLDRYDEIFQNYIDSKFRIIQNQTEKDNFIYCADDEVLASELLKRDIKAQKFPFTIKNNPAQAGFLNQNLLTINTDNMLFEMDTNELPLGGTHNHYNSLAAGIMGKLNDIRNEELKKSFQSFEGVEHRFEKYIKVGGIRFINDSKATNVNSTWYALQSVDTKVVLIMGGVDHDNDYGALKDLVRTKVKAIVCLGLDNSRIRDAFIGMTEIHETSSMNDAVRKAYRLADEGDTVLLSPACKSFDLFTNFEDRGLKFKEAVREL